MSVGTGDRAHNLLEERLDHWSHALITGDNEQTAQISTTISIAEDNQASILEAGSHSALELLKRIDLKSRFLADNIAKDNVAIHYVQTDQMIADIVTKNSQNQTFFALMKLHEMVG